MPPPSIGEAAKGVGVLLESALEGGADGGVGEAGADGVGNGFVFSIAAADGFGACFFCGGFGCGFGWGFCGVAAFGFAGACFLGAGFGAGFFTAFAAAAFFAGFGDGFL